MVGQSRKWMILAASVWIQAFTGTNLDFSSYSSDLKSVLGISQVQLNNLSMASDMGKAFGWCSGVCLKYLPLWVVIFLAAFMGFLGYGLQWLVIQGHISLPYSLVILLSLLAGCSISWFNTVCYVLCINNFPANRPLALSLSISFNGVTAALYKLIVNAINSTDSALYLLLNAIMPLIASIGIVALVLQQHPPQALSGGAIHRESCVFLRLVILAACTGVYLLVLDTESVTSSASTLGAILFLILLLITTRIFCAREWAQRTENSSIELQGTSFNSVDLGDLDIKQKLVEIEDSSSPLTRSNGNAYDPEEKRSCCDQKFFKDRLSMLGEEHSVRLLIHRLDFWLYYLAYFCGGTLGIVYGNNLGQIAQSLGYGSQISSFVSLYSACSFFGRLLSAIPDLLGDNMYYPRTGWLVLGLVPTPIAFLLLVSSGSQTALRTATAFIGLSSGFIVTAAVSMTAELFGPVSTGVNHNILITNIPLGSLLYGLLAALLYQRNIRSSNLLVLMDGSTVCIGRQCYSETFAWWSFISMFGVASGYLLFLRTRAVYSLERNRNWMQYP
ncbi:protein NUCLEAR FUSION DEFECTIVE 4-like [Coffea eugenioides]|uniref:protein NUCLEAR FUSION DEFECTIVE 4-like n=1 Tax=Coffea eugenioides TaxID=49369 RepID=UPI000F6068B0|nr:protein NUCLEAR FUSION DEFECTIVE 4-like [Coffea eugenioides]